MDVASILDSSWYVWVLLPMLIFCSRIVDVSLGTVRVILVSKGIKYLAPLIGFFEVILWLLAIGQVMKNMNNFMCYIAYGGGFATGTFVGIYLEEKLSIGLVIFRIITHKDASFLIDFLKSENYGITVLDGAGAKGSVKIIFTVVERQQSKLIIQAIHRFNPNAFYSLDDVKYANEGVFKNVKLGYSKRFLNFLKFKKK